MQLHELKSKSKRKKSQRRGRGGKRGTYSGRGIKGQKSRAGRRIRKAERDLILRLPKLRGFRNKPKTSKPLVLNIEQILPRLKPWLEKQDQSLVIDRELLEQVGILPRGYHGEVKILGGGKIAVPLTFKKLKFSKSAKIKIEQTGGKIM